MSIISPSSISFQDGECEEVTHQRSTSKRPFSSWERFPFSRTDTIFIQFPGILGEAYCGMSIDGISSQPKLVKKISLQDSLRENSLLQTTSHPNLVNLTGISRTEDGIYFSYESTGPSLTQLRALIGGDAVAVASICKKVSDTPACRQRHD